MVMAYFSITAVRILRALTNKVQLDALVVKSDRHKALHGYFLGLV